MAGREDQSTHYGIIKMSNTIEKRDLDEDYLYAQAAKRGRKPTEDQVDRFCEIVARKCADDTDDATARREALVEVMGG